MSEPTGDRPMKFAYADPPYLGLAKRYDHPETHIYDTVEGHKALIDRLCAEFPDGWAMSLSSPSLRLILPLCPEDVRVCAWTKPFASFKPSVNPAYAWEPVILRGGRKRRRGEDKVRDYASIGVALQVDFHGAKPDGFCFWVFQLLNALPGDELADLFPGSGAVGLAWRRWVRMNDGLFATKESQ